MITLKFGGFSDWTGSISLTLSYVSLKEKAKALWPSDLHFLPLVRKSRSSSSQGAMHYCHCTIALCRFLFRKMSLGEFNLHVSFSLGLFVSDKNIWSVLSLSLHIWVQVDCRPISKQIYKRTRIRKKTGCDEYLEDQLNMASKNCANYPFDEKDGKNIWQICAPWRAGLTKKLVELFFSAWYKCLNAKFHICQTPPLRF